MRGRGKKPGSFREALARLLTPAERKMAIYGFDILGDMALIEIPDALQKKATLISRTLLDTHPFLTRVYEKIGTHSGKYRVEKLRWRAGVKNPVAVAKEWGSAFMVNPGTVYYSPRLGTERQRVISQFKPGQSIVVFFAGVGPYPILAAKYAHPSRVLGIEWNPKAIPFFQENIRLNRVQSLVEAKQGDVSKIKPLPEFDHVVMPGPDSAIEHLSTALAWISPKGGWVHAYTFVSSSALDSESREKVKRALSKSTRSWTVVSIRKVNDFSPRVSQVCILLRVSPLRGSKKHTIKKS